MERGVPAGLMKQTWNNIPVDHKKVREFGLVIFVVAGIIIPAIITWKNDWIITDVTGYLFAGTLAFMGICLLFTKSMYPVYRGWMMLALGMGFVATRIIITLVYLFMMTPVGFIRRQKAGSVYRTFLDFKTNSTDTYWIRRDEPYKKEHTERQF